MPCLALRRSSILSHPHGCVSWNAELIIYKFLKRVTPSRVCELKFVRVTPLHQSQRSHPHGCVSWNFLSFLLHHTRLCHTLTGVWVEICNSFERRTVQWSHPHGCVSWNQREKQTGGIPRATPSRVCELKWWPQPLPPVWWRHTLTGVWVEIRTFLAWLVSAGGHTLTGVWVEIRKDVTFRLLCPATPSRVCELKYVRIYNHVSTNNWPHPHGCVSWNPTVPSVVSAFTKPHPHGCVSWNQNTTSRYRPFYDVTPSRVCELKYKPCTSRHGYQSHTLTGVWVEIR